MFGISEQTWEIFTIAAADRSGTGNIVALEPDPFNQHLLWKTFSHSENTALNIDILPVAVSTCIGVATLSIAQRGRSYNHLVGAGHERDIGGSGGSKLGF